MAKNEPEEIVIKKGVLAQVAEMIGRVLPKQNWFAVGGSLVDLYAELPSVDYSQVNYALTRALFYASEIKDKNGKVYGKQYLLGAAFAKPIVNIAAAFMMGKLPNIRLDIEEEDTDENNDSKKAKTTDDKVEEPNKEVEYTEKKLNRWNDRNKSKIFKILRNSMRDGDLYVMVGKDAKLTLLPPDQIDVVYDEIEGKVIGYNRTQYISGEINGQKKNIKHVTEYRMKSPYRVVKKYDKDKNDEYTTIEKYTITDEAIAPIIVHFANEREPGQLYGNSEYQGIYYLIAMYHAVLENAIKNNLFHSKSTPFITGVENAKTFKEDNGTKDSKGNIKFKWDGKRLLVGGKGFDIKTVSGVITASEADTLLNILFWLIAQHSETPEFAFGTAVKSSKASVSEQMPMLIEKARRKQNEYTEPYEELLSAVRKKLKISYPKMTDKYDIDVTWQPILDEDYKLNLEIVTFLSEEGIVTDKTKLNMLGATRFIADPEKEMEEAKRENKEKQEALDTGAGFVNQPGNELTPEEQEIANATA